MDRNTWSNANVISGPPDTTPTTGSDAGATEVAPTLTGIQIVGNNLS
jgi:hypothetical protein